MKMYPITLKDNLLMLARIIVVFILVILLASIPWEVSI